MPGRGLDWDGWVVSGLASSCALLRESAPAQNLSRFLDRFFSRQIFCCGRLQLESASPFLSTLLVPSYFFSRPMRPVYYLGVVLLALWVAGGMARNVWMGGCRASAPWKCQAMAPCRFKRELCFPFCVSSCAPNLPSDPTLYHTGISTQHRLGILG